MAGYDPLPLEKKWQKLWLEQKIFAAGSPSARPKFYALDMFPYPSGAGLHVGHPEGYTASDIVSRYKRARGFHVMHPMGWDAFGLPAEQYAIKTNTHPRLTTQNNISRFRQQLQAIGFSYDWDREVDTTDPTYYRWTQWIFLQLFDTWFDARLQKGRPIAELAAEFAAGLRPLPGNQVWKNLTAQQQRAILDEHRLAYQANVAVNWCPALGTVLANEEVIDGRSEVGQFPVERRPMKQWNLRITAYAQRLLDGLDALEWSHSLKEMQRNWIGRSEGAEVRFQLPGSADLVVFTTRPDTLYGATYMVLAPEHPLVAKGAGPLPAQWPAGIPACWTQGAPTPAQAVATYQAWTASRSDRERQENPGKTGVFTGLYAINPVNAQPIPVFIADYVLMGYGTGAIMAVPAHDERDFEFATQFQIPIKPVVRSADATKLPFCEEGLAVDSPWIEGLATPAAKTRMIELLEEKQLGRRQINYKIRDWLFSRQRYWGEPFPLVHLEDGSVVALAPEELPLTLPELEDFKPTGTIDPPLSKAPAWFNVQVELDARGFARVVKSGGQPARRELNTMPQWAGSCWYYLRYLDPTNDKAFVDPAIEKYWMTQGEGVDLYIGGVEHAVLHLLYSRFWHKVLFDRGLVSTPEPFRKLVNQGLILGEAEYTVFHSEAGTYVSIDEVDPEFSTRPGPDEKPQVISRHRQSGELLIGKKLTADEVEKKGEGFVLKALPAIRVDMRSFKMSKSRGNVINPDDVIRDYGADSLRLFEMFMGPLEQVKPWSTAGVEGVYRFLQRVWRNMVDPEIEDPVAALRPVCKLGDGSWVRATGEKLSPEQAAAAERDRLAILRPTHRLIRKTGDDIDRMSFNTAISGMMEFNNALGRLEFLPLETALTLVRLLEPFAPHVAEELFARLEPKSGLVSLSQKPWPVFEAELCVDPTLEIPVQINGKLRGRISVASDATEAAVLQAALDDEIIQGFLAGQSPKKKIYIKGRMVNLVV